MKTSDARRTGVALPGSNRRELLRTHVSVLE